MSWYEIQWLAITHSPGIAKGFRIHLLTSRITDSYSTWNPLFMTGFNCNSKGFLVVKIRICEKRQNPSGCRAGPNPRPIDSYTHPPHTHTHTHLSHHIFTLKQESSRWAIVMSYQNLLLFPNTKSSCASQGLK